MAEIFCECHGHIMMNGADYRSAVSAHKNSVDRQAVKDTFETLRRSQVTYFRDGGDAFGVSKFARDIAPDYGIDYVTPIFAIHKKGLYGSIVGQGYRSIPDFIKLTAQVVKEGGDYVKLMFSGILDFNQYGGLSCPSLAPSEIDELVRIVHGEGLRVMAHVNGAEAIKAALEAGTDSIEHGYYSDEECIRLMVETGAVWVPTLAAVVPFCGRDGYDSGVVQRIVSEQKAKIRIAMKMGALVATGSDSGAVGVPHGEGTHTEYQLLRETAGEDNLDIIRKANEKIRTVFRK